ncbi:MAG: polar amino acid transport system substrate-binding protein [Marinobacter psychrophilus]|jgi:polar amino acid transport system substrate-binding protein
MNGSAKVFIQEKFKTLFNNTFIKWHTPCLALLAKSTCSGRYHFTATSFCHGFNLKRNVSMYHSIRTLFRSGNLAKSLTGLAVIISATFCMASTSHALTVEEIEQRGYIKVATEDDYRPFEFIENGKSTGYHNELKELVEKETGLELRQTTLPWSGVLPGITSGKFDIALSAVLVTEARKPNFDFTTPTAASTTIYGTRSDSPIKSAKDLVGKIVGAQTGSAFLAEFKVFNEKLKAEYGEGAKEIVEYASYPEAYQDLGIGRLDAVVNSDLAILSLVAERSDMFIAGEPVSEPRYIAWSVKKGNTAILEIMNGALTKIRESGDMYQLQQKWLRASHKNMPVDVN